VAPEPHADDNSPSTPDSDKAPKPIAGRERHTRRPAASRALEPGPAPAASPAPVAVAQSPEVARPATVAVSQPAAVRAADLVGAASYRVRAGDSLWSIARRIVGSDASAGRVAREVNRLWQLNADRIGTGNPNLLYAGTVLRLS
jgi:Tfp pilus assembly protein FimV